MINEYTWESSLQDYLSKNKITVIKFATLTCPPCKLLEPIFEKVEEDSEEDYTNFVAVNATDHLPLMNELGVKVVPTVVFMHDKDVLERCNGFLTEDRLRGIIDTHVSKL